MFVLRDLSRGHKANLPFPANTEAIAAIFPARGMLDRGQVPWFYRGVTRLDVSKAVCNAVHDLTRCLGSALCFGGLACRDNAALFHRRSYLVGTVAGTERCLLSSCATKQNAPGVILSSGSWSNQFPI
ncbi:hypothetical protein K0M31_007594 [Melipona bicolor]|uniref:Uncharacterized protein n=1 Tax=Melipona bicolor TaxID=60889 RepID=A0AA40GC21_9HYME|nr:hypothetical protein K0M31_007594 [Melipona bicolor]